VALVASRIVDMQAKAGNLGSQFQEPLLSHGGIEGVRVVAIDSKEDFVIDDSRKIPGISKLNNFKFNPESITA